MATNGAREARRRRILEKGTDRLALITGRIDSLPPQPDSFGFRHNKAASHGQIDLPPTELSGGGTNNRSIRSASLDTADRTLGIGGRLEPQLRKSEASADTTRVSPLDTNKEVQTPLFPPTAQVPSNSAVDKRSPHKDVRPHVAKVFTFNNITSSISASEDIRILSAITIALLVVLSHFRIFSIMTTIIVTKPIYLVLLTDATILLARLLSGKQVVVETTREETKTGDSNNAYSWAKGLEIGLVLYKAITAALMDCSLYLVVVICGFSLLQGWF